MMVSCLSPLKCQGQGGGLQSGRQLDPEDWLPLPSGHASMVALTLPVEGSTCTPRVTVFHGRRKGCRCGPQPEIYLPAGVRILVLSGDPSLVRTAQPTVRRIVKWSMTRHSTCLPRWRSTGATLIPAGQQIDPQIVTVRVAASACLRGVPASGPDGGSGWHRRGPSPASTPGTAERGIADGVNEYRILTGIIEFSFRSRRTSWCRELMERSTLRCADTVFTPSPTGPRLMDVDAELRARGGAHHAEGVARRCCMANPEFCARNVRRSADCPSTGR